MERIKLRGDDVVKKALVLGASGGMGYAIVHELVGRGVETVAFARNEERLNSLFGNIPGVSIVPGDVANLEDLQEAADGVDVIFHAMNIPYEQWESSLATLVKNILAVAELVGAKLAVVDNIYAFGRSGGKKITEDHLKNPHTKKGKIRLQTENIIKSSTVPYVIAHFPDFYGPNATNAILHYTLKDVVEGKKAGFVGNKQIEREFIFTPDGAKAIVELSLTEAAYGQNWNIPATKPITGKEVEAILRNHFHYTKSFYTIHKFMIGALGLFQPQMREVVEMLYITEEPTILDGSKYEKLIGPLPKTSYEDGLRETLDYLKKEVLEKVGI